MRASSLLSKSDLVQLYGTTDRSFSAAIEPIKKEIGWRKGKQLFTPKTVRVIFQYLGEPLTREEMIVK